VEVRRRGEKSLSPVIMKTRTAVFLFLAIAIALPLSSPDALARSKKKKKEYVPSPTPTPPGPPSGDLTNFIATQGDKIFAPLEQRVTMPRAELAQLRNSFAQRFARASLVERDQFHAALTICDALSQIMSERERAVLTSSANWPARAAQLRQHIDGLIARERAMESQVIPAASPGR
jgi:hypothetical protein